ncbi:hypothetical protein [Paraburkholderia heleia]|uniref:hypothetical protein n=1 Tax=Paraburkholderia heleia TaxID=634127 RepID=UPI001427A64E|nr:hypothetical protein [Paraburkholderia heleia]
MKASHPEFPGWIARYNPSKFTLSIFFSERFVCLLKDKNPPTNKRMHAFAFISSTCPSKAPFYVLAAPFYVHPGAGLCAVAVEIFVRSGTVFVREPNRVPV